MIENAGPRGLQFQVKKEWLALVTSLSSLSTAPANPVCFPSPSAPVCQTSHIAGLSFGSESLDTFSGHYCLFTCDSRNSPNEQEFMKQAWQ